MYSVKLKKIDITIKKIENKVLITTVKKKENRNKLIFKTKGNYLLAACAAKTKEDKI